MKTLEFKILQRRLKFRNPNHLLSIPENFMATKSEILEAQKYLDVIQKQEIRFAHPQHPDYPLAFYQMKEPPLFFEFIGEPFWSSYKLISIVGSRQISELSTSWMKNHLGAFLSQNNIAVVSGGALGIDQMAHLISLKNKRPSVFILPSGVKNKYPKNLIEFEQNEFKQQTCFLSEFESNQQIHKSHFYFRNRLIAAMGELTLIVQASLKSGSLLTVHHCLENGRPLLVVPAHPENVGFEGNLKLLREGAYPIASDQDLLDFWNAEFHGK